MGDTGADAAAYKEEGNAKFKHGEFKEAAELYAKAIDLDPSNAVLYRSAGMQLLCAAQSQQTRVGDRNTHRLVMSMLYGLWMPQIVGSATAAVAVLTATAIW
jgi:tetratricopeptide (TPR) repeat protein